MIGEQNWEWNQNDALKAAGTITDLRIKLSQAEQLRDQYRGDLVVVNNALDGHASEIIRLTAALEISNDSRLELLQQRDRWYAAAGQRQDELNEAHAAIREMFGLVLAVKAGEPREAIWTLLKAFTQMESKNRAVRVAMAAKP